MKLFNIYETDINPQYITNVVFLDNRTTIFFSLPIEYKQNGMKIKSDRIITDIPYHEIIKKINDCLKNEY